MTRPNVVQNSLKIAPYQLRHTGPRCVIEDHLICNYWCPVLFLTSRQLCQSTKEVIYIFLVRVGKLTIDHLRD